MTALLSELYNNDFSDCSDSQAFRTRFFAKTLGLAELKQVFAVVEAAHADIAGRAIPSALLIPANKPSAKAPFIILAQLHGNEPAGLAGIALAMALAGAGALSRDIVGVIGNPLAARQYFAAWEADPKARQETRDAYRCGLDEQGNLLPDMNRIPVDFLTREPLTAHDLRARELYWLGQHCSGIADLHSARGSMLCITDHKHDRDLRNTPLRCLLTGLAEAISAHASATVSVQTLKTILHPLENIESQTGIEAGKHESVEAPRHAAEFTLALLHTLGISAIAPEKTDDDGRFTGYHVKPKLTYADLTSEAILLPQDKVYMAIACDAAEHIPKRSSVVIVRLPNGPCKLQTILQFIIQPAGELCYAVYQYDEMEAVAAGHVVAVAVPSGVTFEAPEDFSVLFISKAAALYDKDPAVGPWPVNAEQLDKVKFCYPCEVSEMVVDLL